MSASDIKVLPARRFRHENQLCGPYMRPAKWLLRVAGRLATSEASGLSLALLGIFSLFVLIMKRYHPYIVIPI